jgi:glycosyltransferase involved in cell wall biosynthesis
VRILFIHQNLPGQFQHLLYHYMTRKDAEIMGIGERKWVKENLPKLPKGFKVAVYDLPSDAERESGPHLKSTVAAVYRGLAVVEKLQSLKQRGFVPDVVYVHPGWGEALYIKDVFPSVRLVNFCEFFYRANGQDVGFDPEYPSSFDEILQLRTRSAPHLLSLDSMDLGISPTDWQRKCFPQAYQTRIEVVHDGVDTDVVRPNPRTIVRLPTGAILSRSDEVITFVSRNLEPYRGFHSFMRALPEVLKERPKARILVVGGDGVSYGKPHSGGTYREQLLEEVGPGIGADLERVHFLGRIPYRMYLDILQISKAHVYLTYPFVLSWSMLEAMASGCVVVGSRTRPVQEVIEEGRNGLLVDFFSPQEIANSIIRACRDAHNMAPIRQAARETVIERYDLRRVCLPKQIALLESDEDGKGEPGSQTGGTGLMSRKP